MASSTKTKNKYKNKNKINNTKILLPTYINSCYKLIYTYTINKFYYFSFYKKNIGVKK
jgi:hypothetical protein